MTRERDDYDEIKAVNPVDLDSIERLELDEGREQVLAGIFADDPAGAGEEARTRPRRWHRPGRSRPRRLALGLAVSAAAAVVLVVIGVGLGSTGSTAPALGAGLTHLAKVSPNVLLDAPGWRLEAEYRDGGELGVLHFHRDNGGPVYHLGGRLVIYDVDSAQLEWRLASGGTTGGPHGEAVFTGSARALGAPARIYTRRIAGPAGDKYFAVWTKTGRRFELTSIAPSLAAFKRRLSALRTVGRDEWLAALSAGHLVRSGGWLASSAWREPASSAIAVKDCSEPLPAQARAAGTPSQLRIYEHQCGHTNAAGAPMSGAHAGDGHTGGASVTECRQSEAQSLNMTNAIEEQLEAEGRCRTTKG